MAFTKRKRDEEGGSVLQLSPQRNHTPLLEGSLSEWYQIAIKKSSGFTFSIDCKDRGTLFSDHLTFDNLHLGASQVALTGLLKREVLETWV